MIGLAVLLLSAARVSAEECYCDRWYSTNTRTLDFPDTAAECGAGMSYRGSKSTTVNGIECLPWAEAFARCTAGFEARNLDPLDGPATDHSWLISTYMSHMMPDRLGIRDEVKPTPPFDDFQTSAANECRMPSLREAWLKSETRYSQPPDADLQEGLGFMPPDLGASGPFCFVDANDPRAAAYTSANGWSWGEVGINALRQACPEVTPVPCGISRCAPDAESASEVGCERATASASGGSARLLMANGAMELWARRTKANGLVRNAELTRNPPTTWADVTYSEYPNFPEGANPAEPRFWDLCLFGGGDIERQGLGYNASTDGANVGHLLHKLGALVQCDAVVPRAQGVSLSEHSPGRGGGTTSAARVAFVKASDTAALKAEHGAMAAMAPNAVHVARAWVRCAKGSATVALVVSRLPETARTSEDEATVTHYDAFENVRSGSGNVLACDVAASAYTATSDAPEAVSGWTQLEVAVRSAKAEHEVTVQVVVQSHSNDAAVLIDDVEFEVEAADASSVCAGGGGAGVSYKAAHKCSSDPTHLFYDLRERGGVPVAFEQVHAMVRIGFRSVSCKKPTLDATSAAECAFISRATLPHLGADEVRAYMDARSDDELAAEMGWAEEGARGPGVLAGASVAVGILRAGLPDAIATGVIRTVDGPEYNIPLSPTDNPNIASSPTSGIAWHAMSGTTDFQVFGTQMHLWHQCGHHAGVRKALCNYWAELEYVLGCGLVQATLSVDGWEDFIGFEGYIGIERIMNEHYVTILEPIVQHFSDLTIEGEILCHSSVIALYDSLKLPPPEIQAESSDLSLDCAGPLSRPETLAVLSLILPLAAPRGMTCVNLLTVDYDTAELYEHHEYMNLRPGGGDDDDAAVPWPVLLGICLGGAFAAIASFSFVRARRRARRGAARRSRSSTFAWAGNSTAFPRTRSRDAS